MHDERDVVLAARGLGKCYRVYKRPEDRLWQGLFGGRGQLYREFWALRNVSFELRRGESVGIIGRNGAGKSTLLQIVAGTLTPTEGSVEVSGRVTALLELGSGFHPEYTGRENVLLNGAIFGVPRADMEARLADIAAFADIGEFLDQPIKLYSSGMLARLAFAVQVFLDPQLLIVDEALAVGDIFFQQKCFRYLREQLADTTKILVSHDLGSIAQVCKRVLVVDHGHIVFDGEPKRAFERYYQLYHGEGTSQASPGPADDVPAAAEWMAVSDEVTHSGRSEFRIRSVAILRNGKPIGGHAETGDAITVRLLVEACRASDRLIAGLLIVDRFGQSVCGQNSRSVGQQLTAERPGRMTIELAFRWPAIAPGEYTITVGVGEGDHPFQHTVQSWAHNVAAVRSVHHGTPIHGLTLLELSAVRTVLADAHA